MNVTIVLPILLVEARREELKIGKICDIKRIGNCIMCNTRRFGNLQRT